MRLLQQQELDQQQVLSGARDPQNDNTADDSVIFMGVQPRSQPQPSPPVDDDSVIFLSVQP